MNSKTMKNVMALGAGGALFAGAVAIATASPSWAMPVLSNMAAVRTAASNQKTDVHYYRRGYYRRGISVVAIMAVAITVVAMVTPMGATLIPMLIVAAKAQFDRAERRSLRHFLAAGGGALSRIALSFAISPSKSPRAPAPCSVSRKAAATFDI